MYVDLSNMNSGFCDRLRQLTFCIAYEIMQKKKIRVIEIYEKKNKECPFFISDLIKIKNFKIKNVKKKNKKEIKMDPFNSEISIKNCLKFNSKKLDNTKLLKKWKDTYQLLSLKQKNHFKLNNILKKKKFVAIHIRLTDKLISFKNHFLEIPSKDIIYYKQFQEFIINIGLLIPKNYKYIYISSDENFYRRLIRENLKNKFQFIERNIIYNNRKLRQTSGEDFVIDLFAMAKSSMIISSTGGNVPLTSNLISGLKQKYIKWTTYKVKYIFYLKIRMFIYFVRNLVKF